jgi:threonine synthase
MQCTRCKKAYSTSQPHFVCRICGGTLTIKYDYESVDVESLKTDSHAFGVWGFWQLLPLNYRENIVSLGEGNTFLHSCDRLGEQIGLRRLLAKDESTNPTGAFVDRGTTVVVSKAKEFGYRSVHCTTKGNLGASLAAYSAKAGFSCRVLVPGKVDLGKFYQMVAYGVQIEVSRRRVEDEYGETLDQPVSYGAGSYPVTTSDPFLLEGEKTTGYEVCQQLGWSCPDWLVVPMGSGSHLAMIWKGMKELEAIGLVDSRKVKIAGIQAEGCAPIVEAFLRGTDRITPAKATRTIAVDMAVRNPKHGYLALQALRESKGAAVAVSDYEIIEAMKILAKAEGIFAEPAAASTIAGIKLLVDSGRIDRTESVVCVITGMGLKDPSSARKLMGRTQQVRRAAQRIEGVKFRVGKTKLGILQVLSEQELHGYGVWRALQRLNIKLDISSVYQHLTELEAGELIRRTKTQSLGGRPVRLYYRITTKGGDLLRSMSAET